MNSYLVYYIFYYDSIANPDHPVENINVKISYVYADDEYQAELWLLDYFGENTISIIKSEKV